MNEQIRKLAVKSGIDIRGHLTGFLFVDEKPNVTELEKFAELIVKECANICNGVGVAVFSEPVQNNLGTAQTCKIAIEKHFGVEE